MEQNEMTPLIGILNHTDRPTANMLVLIWAEGDAINVEYVANATPAFGPLGRIGDFPAEFTEIAEFGVSVRLGRGAGFEVSQYDDSIATYPDGRIRHWQGRDREHIAIRLSIAQQLVAAVTASSKDLRRRVA